MGNLLQAGGTPLQEPMEIRKERKKDEKDIRWVKEMQNTRVKEEERVMRDCQKCCG